MHSPSVFIQPQALRSYQSPVAGGGGNGAAPSFAGKKKKRKEAQEISERLQEKGITRDAMKKQWGVTLWRVKDKKDKMTFKVDPGNKKLDVAALKEWLAVKLGVDKDIKIKEKDAYKGCCKEHCSGCFNGNGDELQDQWIPSDKRR